MQKPVLGILGGVGPLATAYFMKAIIQKTPAKRDQDNIPMIVFNDPQIPDRTAYILDQTQPNPQPEMVKVAHRLEEAGADYLAIACNTAHYFYDAIVDAVNIPVLNIMSETAGHIAKQVGAGGHVGLMATDGTIESGVFQNYFQKAQLKTIIPSKDDRAALMSLIYDCVKANKPYDLEQFLGIAERLHQAGADAVVVGCTELSVIYQDLAARPSYLYDSLDILADRCVDFYQARQLDEKNVR
ncbi:MAG: aspartate/glutamate racemase family protein [Atopobiaceae bacterium]|jgi:aspartate racemase